MLIPSMIKLTATHCDNPEKYLPVYKTEGAACADLFACIPPNVVDGVNIGSKHQFGFRTLIKINCGFSVAIPDGFKLCISLRSGLASQGLFVTNSPGQVDSDYRGEIQVIVANFSHSIITISDGERFAQCWLEPVYKPDWRIVTALPETDRGEGGFGSTGL